MLGILRTKNRKNRLLCRIRVITIFAAPLMELWARATDT